MLNDYRQIVSALKGSPWLITQEGLEMIVEIVNMRLSGEAFSEEEIKTRIALVESEQRNNPRVEVSNGIGVVSMYGPMFPKANLMTELSGATSLETFRGDLAALVEDDSVKQIVLDMDTPGGSAEMTPETGNVIREAREVKPVYAIANWLSASGGLWLGSQATKFYSTESGKVGSLGVYHVIEDHSRRDEAEGRKVTFISAGKFKTAGNPHEPLSEETKEYIQAQVDEIQHEFISAVAEGRGLSYDKVKNDFGDAKIHSAKSALKIGMIDGIVSMDDLLGELVESNATHGRSSLSMAVHRMHNESQVLDMSQGGKSRIKTIVDGFRGGNLRTESASQEHQDPPADDEGKPNPDQGGQDKNPGSRTDTPAIAKEEVEGGDVVDFNIEAFLRETFSIPEGDDIKTHMEKVHSEVAPLREAAAAADEKNAFAEQYPEEAARLQRLEEKDRKVEASTFSQSYAHFKNAQGQTLAKGFSQAVLDLIEDKHVTFFEGEGSVSDLKEILDTIAADGVVELAERGSSRVQDVVISDNAGKAFSELVADIQKEDKLDYSAAVKVAATKHPNEFEAYRRQARPHEGVNN